MLTAFEDALVRTTSLILAALSGRGSQLADAGRAMSDAPANVCAPHAPRRPCRPPRRPAGARRLLALCTRADHWRIGWRRLSGPDTIDLRGHPALGWRTLPDDGRRYYADPFPVADASGTVLFMEEYAYVQGRGVISAIRFGPDGPLGTPVPVLEAPHHLSYPCVFAADGAYWMVPESGTSGTVDLYRATAFPGGWVKEATLLDGLCASDPTLFRHGDRWWLFASVRDDASARGRRPLRRLGFLFRRAPSLVGAGIFRGPWAPHPGTRSSSTWPPRAPGGTSCCATERWSGPPRIAGRGTVPPSALARIERLNDDGIVSAWRNHWSRSPFPGSGPAYPESDFGLRIHRRRRTGAAPLPGLIGFAIRPFGRLERNHGAQPARDHADFYPAPGTKCPRVASGSARRTEVRPRTSGSHVSFAPLPPGTVPWPRRPLPVPRRGRTLDAGSARPRRPQFLLADVATASVPIWPST